MTKKNKTQKAQDILEIILPIKKDVEEGIMHSASRFLNLWKERGHEERKKIQWDLDVSSEFNGNLFLLQAKYIPDTIFTDEDGGYDDIVAKALFYHNERCSYVSETRLFPADNLQFEDWWIEILGDLVCSAFKQELKESFFAFPFSKRKDKKLIDRNELDENFILFKGKVLPPFP